MAQPKHKAFIAALVQSQAKRYGVRIYQFKNLGNHIHVALRVFRRKDFTRFVKSVSSIIAQRMTGARKGKAFGKFFDQLVHSRIVEWGKDRRGVFAYIVNNEEIHRERYRKTRKTEWPKPTGVPGSG